MKDANAQFCSLMLKLARKDIKEAGIKVGKLVTWKDSFCDYYEIWEGEGSSQVWMGSASCASEAKAAYLGILLERRNTN